MPDIKEDMVPNVPAPRTTIGQINKKNYIEKLSKGPPSPEEQLSFYDAFVENTPQAYTNLWEFFDHIPKFFLTPQTSFRKGKSLDIVKFEFEWGGMPCSVSIPPVVLDSRDPETGKDVRKEIIPGPREECVYRVLKKMAADPEVRRITGEKGVFLRFTLHHLRMRLKAVSHEYKVIEIKESLQVLNRSALKVVNLDNRKQMYAGTYLDVRFTSTVDDESGEGSVVEVRFNDLAVASITAGLYNRIHYERLMSLRPLGAWIYELITRNFRQAGASTGYRLSLSRVLNESGLPQRKALRANIRMIREALDELEKKGVLAFFPPRKEEVEFSGGGGRGRKAIKEVVWTLFPHDDVVKDIRVDNAEQQRRRELTSQAPRRRMA